MHQPEARPTRSWVAIATLIAAIAGTNAPPARAQETTLRAVTAMPEATIYSKRFVEWIREVNAEGKGVLRIDYIAGTAIPAFEVGNAVKSGVVDLANANGGLYTNVMPESDALKLATVPIAEQRRNGAFEYINSIWQSKGNMVYLGRVVEAHPMHLYVNRKITEPDLAGMRIRITPLVRDFVQALGATAVNVPPGEVFTALERGVVDGYNWPIAGLFDLNLQQRTKFRIGPGFYDAEISLIMNLDTWKKLPARQRQFLEKKVLDFEARNGEYRGIAETETKRQTEAGVQSIRFEPAAARRYVERAYEVGWAAAIKASPQHGPKLRELIYRPMP